jgi:excisionase family DNA binding protein
MTAIQYEKPVPRQAPPKREPISDIGRATLSAIRPSKPIPDTPPARVGAAPLPPMPVPSARDPFLTVAEISHRLKVSKMSVYRLLNNGDIASIRVGRSFRVRESVFERWLAEGGTGEGYTL